MLDVHLKQVPMIKYGQVMKGRKGGRALNVAISLYGMPLTSSCLRCMLVRADCKVMMSLMIPSRWVALRVMVSSQTRFVSEALVAVFPAWHDVCTSAIRTLSCVDCIITCRQRSGKILFQKRDSLKFVSIAELSWMMAFRGVRSSWPITEMNSSYGSVDQINGPI